MEEGYKHVKAETSFLQLISLLNATLESVTDGILVVDTERRIVKYNNKFKEMWCIPQKVIEIKNDDTALFCVLDQLIDSDGFLEKVNTLYSTPTAESFDTLNFKDGRIFERYSRPQYIGNQVVGRVWSFRDVTKKKKVEESLEKALAFFEGVIESPKDVVIFALDRQYRYIAFNRNHHQTMQKIWGVDIVLGKSMLDYITNSNDRLKAKNNFDRAFSGESFTLEEEYGDTALERRYYEDIYNPIIDENGNIIGLTLFLTDITERKKTQEALKMSEERLKSAAKAANFGVYSHDFSTQRTFYSSEFLRLMGVPDNSQDSTNDLIVDVIHPDDKAEYIRLLKESNDPSGSGNFEHEYRIILPNGEISWLKMIGRTVFSGNQPYDQPLFTNGVILDISRRKFAEIELKKVNDDLERRVLERTAQLKKSNATLSMMLDYAQKVEKDIQERVVANLRTNILSIIDALKKQQLTNTTKELVKTLETTTLDLAHPLAKKLDSPLLKLTPREIQMANLIRLGKSTKEIMGLLHISEKTIETHRNRLRKKLGIRYSGTNLRTFLSSEILE